MPDDPADLVALAKGGDQQAFEELVRQTYLDSYALAFRLTGNEEDARDVVQESYLRAYRGLKRFRGDAQFSTWLYRITANCAANQLRKRSRHRHDVIDDELATVADERSDNDPAAMAETADLRAWVSEALDELPSGLRAVVVLRDMYDMGHEAIAAELGISESAATGCGCTVRAWVLRARVFPARGEQGESGSEEQARAM